MIAFLNEYGYQIIMIELLLIWLVILYQSKQPPLTAEENEVIMESLEHRQNSRWLHTTKSRWGED